jgi:hypothetical protein
VHHVVGARTARRVEDLKNVSARRITQITRHKIFDTIALARVSWSGRLEEPDFLGRIYDLTAMKSTDTRFKDAAGDIYQHRVLNPMDWDDDWIFTDSRFGLQYGDDEVVLRFLAEMLHPMDEAEVAGLLKSFNEALARDGYELYPAEWIPGPSSERYKEYIVMSNGKRRPTNGAAPPTTLPTDRLQHNGFHLRDAIEALGGQLKDWTVMGDATDPFRMDTPANHRDGRWLRDTMARLGLTQVIHDRGLHYAILGQPTPFGCALCEHR